MKASLSHSKKPTRIFCQFARSATLACAVLASTAQASPAGQVNFEDLSEDYGEPKVEINLNANLLRMVSGFSHKNDPKVSQLLSKLEGVTVKVYKLQGKRDAAVSSLEKLSKQLKAEAWQAVVSVNEENELVRILSRSTEGKMDGLVIMVVEGIQEKDQIGEAVFINIVGEIDPADIGELSSSLNLDLGNHAQIPNGTDKSTHNKTAPEKNKK